MSNPRTGQREAFEHRTVAIPIQALGLLASAPEAPQLYAANLLVECAQRREVVGDTVVAVVTAQHAGIPAMLVGQRRVHVPPRLLAQLLQLARHALALCLALHDEPAVPGPPAVVGKAKKGEGSRTPLAALSSSQGQIGRA